MYIYIYGKKNTHTLIKMTNISLVFRSCICIYIWNGKSFAHQLLTRNYIKFYVKLNLFLFIYIL